jgi:ElaB/YqjD/DUF883 family membrane-anchored ribosome-binding protein
MDRSNGTIGEVQGSTSESTAAVRQDLAATRERMSGTIAEIEQRVAGTIEGVKQKVGDAKQKVDVIALVRQHPWPALAAAFVAGVALSASGADRRAARATTRAAKQAPGAAKRGATQAARATASGVSQLAAAAKDRISGSSDDSSVVTDEARAPSGLKAKAAGVLRELGDEVQRGADQLAVAAPPPPIPGV